jgi:molybdate transport system substrate-binding protein
MGAGKVGCFDRVNRGKAHLTAAFDGKLCTGETCSVPVGIYAKEASQNLGLWDGIQARLVGTEDVRAALAFVERAECAAAIVYATDAAASGKVETVAAFPTDSYAPIVYPAALAEATPAAKAFLEYLQGNAAAEVFRKYGFRLLGRP